MINCVIMTPQGDYAATIYDEVLEPSPSKEDILWMVSDLYYFKGIGEMRNNVVKISEKILKANCKFALDSFLEVLKAGLTLDFAKKKGGNLFFNLLASEIDWN